MPTFKELDWSDKQPNSLKVTQTDNVVVSTVRLPIDFLGYHYETMVFACDRDANISSWSDLDIKRYNNEEEAIKGHESMCIKWEAIN